MGGACSVNTADDTTRELRLLLLGSPGVGKSTVFKQLSLIYTNGFDDAQRRALRPHILFDIFDSILTIAEVARQRDGEDFLVDTKLQTQLREIIIARDSGENSSSILAPEPANAVTESGRLDLSSPKSDAYVKLLLVTVTYILQDAKMTRAIQNMKDQAKRAKLEAVGAATTRSNAKANAASRLAPLHSFSDNSDPGTDDSQGSTEAMSAEADEVSQQDQSGSEAAQVQRMSTLSAAAAAEIAARAAERVELPASWDHFSKRLHQMAAADSYIPSDNDILRLRRVTEEAVSLRFNVPVEWPPKSNKTTVLPVQCTDVGGQTQHEYDWAQHGHDVTAVLYVMCPSEFDEIDDEGNNKLVESLRMLRKVASADVFARAQKVILFNKSDLLERKLRTTSFSDYSRSFKGANTVKDVTAFLEKRCRSIIESSTPALDMASAPRVSVVKTCAIETHLTSTVIKRVLVGLFESTFSHIWA